MRVQSRFIVIPLCSKLRLVTKGGSGNDFSDPAERSYLDLNVDLSPYLAVAESLTLFSLIEEPSAGFRAGFFSRSGFDRANEGGPIQVGATLPASAGATESTRHAAYNNLASFQLFGRGLVGYGNADAVTTIESAVLSLALGILVSA